MLDRFGIPIAPCPNGENDKCRFYREGSDCYCASIFWKEFDAKSLCFQEKPKRFACAKYPNDP